MKQKKKKDLWDLDILGELWGVREKGVFSCGSQKK